MKKPFCGYDIADGELCRVTKLNENGHCKKHAPEYEPVQHTPPLYAPWYADEDGFVITSAKLDMLSEVGQFGETFANALVLRINCHEELVQAVKDLLSRGAHGDEWRTVSEKRAMSVIAKAEGR